MNQAPSPPRQAGWENQILDDRAAGDGKAVVVTGEDAGQDLEHTSGQETGVAEAALDKAGFGGDEFGAIGQSGLA